MPGSDEKQHIGYQQIIQPPVDKNLDKLAPAQTGKDLLDQLEKTIVKQTDNEPDLNETASLFAKDDIIAQKYQVIDLIGRGSMGLVYRAQQIALDRVVAIKVLFSDKPLDLVPKKRFEREAHAVALLTHPNVVSVYDSGVLENGVLYLAMEYLEGQTLADILEKQPRLSFREAMPIFRQVCLALEYAHNHGVIHRDLKPSNIMLAKDYKGEEIAKVIDFSIAKFLKPKPDQKTLTRPGEVFGSPLYMSPEQCQAIMPDNRSDIYSLGCLMYEVLCGAPPFMGDNALATIYMHVHTCPTPISALTRDNPLPDYLEGVVYKALEKEPEKRYQSVGELLQALELVCEHNDKQSKPGSRNWLQQVGKYFS